LESLISAGDKMLMKKTSSRNETVQFFDYFLEVFRNEGARRFFMVLGDI